MLFVRLVAYVSIPCVTLIIFDAMIIMTMISNISYIYRNMHFIVL